MEGALDEDITRVRALSITESNPAAHLNPVIVDANTMARQLRGDSGVSKKLHVPKFPFIVLDSQGSVVSFEAKRTPSIVLRKYNLDWTDETNSNAKLAAVRARAKYALRCTECLEEWREPMIDREEWCQGIQKWCLFEEEGQATQKVKEIVKATMLAANSSVERSVDTFAEDAEPGSEGRLPSKTVVTGTAAVISKGGKALVSASREMTAAKGHVTTNSAASAVLVGESALEGTMDANVHDRTGQALGNLNGLTSASTTTASSMFARELQEAAPFLIVGVVLMSGLELHRMERHNVEVLRLRGLLEGLSDPELVDMYIENLNGMEGKEKRLPPGLDITPEELSTEELGWWREGLIMEVMSRHGLASLRTRGEVALVVAESMAHPTAKAVLAAGVTTGAQQMVARSAIPSIAAGTSAGATQAGLAVGATQATTQAAARGAATAIPNVAVGLALTAYDIGIDANKVRKGEMDKG